MLKLLICKWNNNEYYFLIMIKSITLMEINGAVMIMQFDF